MSVLCKRLSLALLLVCLLSAGMSWAGDDKAQAKKEIRQDKREIAQTRLVLDEFKQAIDRWHMANLEGDPDKIERHQNKLFGLIRADIKKSHVGVQKRELEAGRSAGDLEGRNIREERHDLRVDLANLKVARQLVMAKEKLFFAVKRSKSFSNRYRLLNDYVELLQRELGVVRMELAEDIAEARQGK